MVFKTIIDLRALELAAHSLVAGRFFFHDCWSRAGALQIDMTFMNLTRIVRTRHT